MPPGLRLSFQRFRRPLSGLMVGSLPSSLGALPIARGRQVGLLVPVAEDEAFWIGLDCSALLGPTEVEIYVDLHGGRELEHVGRWSQADPKSRSASLLVINGFIDSQARTRAFVRTDDDNFRGCDGLIVRTGRPGLNAFETSLRLVSYKAFTEETGRPPPTRLDASAAYAGWRLP